MKRATFELIGVSPYCQARFHNTEKLDKEGHDDHEKRTWRNKLHTDAKGYVFVPNFALKNCLAEVAKFLSIQIPGKGKSTYTKNFEAGLMVEDNITLPVKAAEVQGVWMHVPSDGMRGGKKRVRKCFPVIQEWRGMASVLILDDTITEDVFKLHLDQAGKFIGLGTFRPRNNGVFGRFDIKKIKWEKI